MFVSVFVRSPRPHFGPFLCPALLSDPVPSTFRPAFVSGSWGFAVRDMSVAGNCLCVRELLNVRAANGEHGEVGSGWCTESWVPPACLVCLIPARAVHVFRFEVCLGVLRGRLRALSGYGKFPKIYGGGALK